MAGDPTFYGLRFNNYFIDIGVPEDYFRAQEEFKTLFSQDEFLFLDRDGVLNRQIIGDYVRNWSQWEWLPGVLEAMPALSKRYKRIFIVTNQQGVGKGFMTEADLEDVHRHMLADIEAAGGRIDRVYVCTDLESTHSPNRKPEIGMALQAQHDFPEVDFHRSVMVGDSKSDEIFAQRSRMRFVKRIPTLGLER
ncbi:MAG: HAD-IIIA family hydrolase [Paludibacteraceae bacterium]|nr:HAD-IIIA family hydrolase [Paludibacteraceae bacterium]